MRIAFLHKIDNFGIGNHIFNLRKELSRLGIESKIFSSKGNYRTNLIPMNKKRELEKFDIVHVQGSPFGSEIGKLKIPKVVTVHTLLKDEIKYEKRISYWLGQSFEEKTLQDADAIILINECLMNTLKMYNPNLSFVSVIPNGVDVGEFDLVESGERFGILFGGRKGKRKNFGDIIKACEMLNVLAYSFGFNHYLTREELVNYYKNSKMFVCASDYETGPITVLEAMAGKCPVIAKNIDGLSWADGLYRSFSNFNSLLDCIKDLNENGGCENMVEKAYQYVKENRSWSKIAKQTISVYEKLMGGE